MAIPLRDVPLDEKVKLTVSERTPAALAPALESWLAGRAGASGRPAVTGVRLPDSGGMSSTSVLFEADWGDARIGNIIYADFEPVAVLDWEMAALGPRELDVSWFIFSHRFFQDIAEFFGLPGLPGFSRRSDVERCYQELSGHPLRGMDFHLTYAAVRHAIAMVRVKRRMIHFGEDQVPEDPDDYVMHRASLEKLLVGTYRWD